MEQVGVRNGLVTGIVGGGLETPAQAALRSISWLQEVPRQILDRLASGALLHRVPAGSLVFEQAESPVFAQILLAGSIELLGVRDGLETLIELLRPINLVIPAAVISDQPYLMRARVYDEAHLLLIPAETFRQTLGSDLALCRAVLGCLAAQFRRQVRSAKNLRLRSAEDRVGSYLVALLQREHHPTPIHLPVGKQQIASQLGMTRETFSRALSGMVKFGMRVSGRILEAEDAAAARARFPFDPLIDGVEPILPLRAREF
jgi:CRP/FNR family transcriptional activator FtrB